jgi:hypothetical protein
MPRHCRRIVLTAVVTLFLSYAPCFAQPAPVPPPKDAPVVMAQPLWQPPAPLNVVPPPTDAPVVTGEPQPENNCGPWGWIPSPEQVWDLLAETPAHWFGYYQAAGFGFGQASVPSASYRVTWFPSASVPGQPTDLSAVREDFRWSCPLWRDESQTFGLTASVRNVLTDTSVVLPATGQPFPDNLWDVRLGFNYKYLFANGWTTGVAFDFGSASDHPFDALRDLTLGFSTFLRIPVGEHNAWLFTLTYSPTGELDFPVPGVAFYWQPSDSFNATIGIPTKVVWRPAEDVLLEASYMPLTTVTAKAAWRIWGGVSVYAAYEMGNESYFLSERQDDRERFFYYDQRVIGGVKLQFGPHCSVDLFSGYAFDRFYFEGDSFSDRHDNRIDVADSPLGSLMVEIRY